MLQGKSQQTPTKLVEEWVGRRSEGDSEGGSGDGGGVKTAFKKEIKKGYTSHSRENHTHTLTQFWTMASTTTVVLLPKGRKIFNSVPELFFIPEFVSFCTVPHFATSWGSFVLC